MERNIRALGLFSGGLDSQLAACVLREQGVEVELVVFDSPFYNPEVAVKAADQLGIELHVVDFTQDIVGLIDNPPHGFGSCMNPCIDCHALMFRRAGEMMLELGCDFIFTGEVLNQRPMSQNRQSLGVVARDSTFADLVLRPLSAKLLEPSKPEREGWVDRDKLLGLSGRSRKPQMKLAEYYGIKEYPSPAGGCRLTDPGYSRRLADLKKHEGISNPRDLTLLRYGRHFRLESGTKLVLGRHAEDNAEIEKLAGPEDILLSAADIPGPTGFLPAGASENDLNVAASILAYYLRHKFDGRLSIRLRSGESERIVSTVPANDKDVDALMIRGL